MPSYKDLCLEDLCTAIRNVQNVRDDEVKKIFYDIRNKISKNKEDMEKVLYLLKYYRPN